MAKKSRGVDLPSVLEASGRLALGKPMPADLSVALLADQFRDAGLSVLDPELLTIARDLDHRQKALVSILARMTEVSAFRETFVAEAGKTVRKPLGRKTLGRWLDAVGPIRFEDVVESAQRQEEILRKWLMVLDFPIQEETVSVSQKRLDKVDSSRFAIELAWEEHGQGPEGSSNFATSRRAQGTIALVAGLGLALLPSMVEGISRPQSPQIQSQRTRQPKHGVSS